MSEWSGGHPRTHSGVTSTHRPNFASFFPPRVTHAHRMESRAHTAIFQSHPRTQTGVTSTHRNNFASFFPPRVTRAHITWDWVGWGGDILLHLHTCSKILYTCPNFKPVHPNVKLSAFPETTYKLHGTLRIQEVSAVSAKDSKTAWRRYSKHVIIYVFKP